MITAISSRVVAVNLGAAVTKTWLASAGARCPSGKIPTQERGSGRGGNSGGRCLLTVEREATVHRYSAWIVLGQGGCSGDAFFWEIGTSAVRLVFEKDFLGRVLRSFCRVLCGEMFSSTNGPSSTAFDEMREDSAASSQG